MLRAELGDLRGCAGDLAQVVAKGDYQYTKSLLSPVVADGSGFRPQYGYRILQP
ncbi:MAG: hypothetical protein OXC12_02990 [Spirochaetaceae bacterium]|nr:hypothetical protein [Spirochaetaceae bacterium]